MPQARRGILAARLGRLRADEAGGAAVEGAIVFAALLGLTLGTIEMGRLLFAYHAISQGAMEGARYAIVRGATSDAPASSEQIADYVKGRITGLDPADLSVAVSWDPNNQPGSPVTVRVDYDFDFIALGLDPVSLSRASTVVISR